MMLNQYTKLYEGIPINYKILFSKPNFYQWPQTHAWYSISDNTPPAKLAEG